MQCRQCGYAGCRPYAQAIADGLAPINRCPPGGAAGIDVLARLTGRPALPLDPRCGTEQPLQVAFVVEALCIGCTKCLQACPVDAISGAAGWLHTVVPALCTGCRLCVAPCPVDCIEMREVSPPRAWTPDDAAAARARHDARAARQARERAERERTLAGKSPGMRAAPAPEPHRQAASASSPVPAVEPQSGPCARPTVDPAIGPAEEPSASEAAASLARKRAVIEAAVERARVRAAARAPARRIPERPAP